MGFLLVFFSLCAVDTILLLLLLWFPSVVWTILKLICSHLVPSQSTRTTLSILLFISDAA